jgi:bifunctional non-homologous end joining protein LigD
MAGPEEADGDRLERYRAKRAFDQTPEPSGAGAGDEGTGLRFVVQKHDARRLHYDFRLEADGVLISWAVPKGPSYDPKTKRLAVHVEDHPLDYRGFEGVIPGAQYGSGTVIVWDEGTYRNLTQREGRQVDVAAAVERGHVSVWLEGTKLRGGWSLTRTGGRGAKESWIMVKRADERADPDLDIETTEPHSVRTGRSLAEIGAAPESEKQWTRERATWRPPMLAQLIKPAEHLRGGGSGAWRYERKLDGLRGVAVRNGDQVELWSRNHLSFNRRFPEIVAALARLGLDNFTLDGEIVAFVKGRTSFGRLQQRDPSDHPVFCAFDLLSLLGQDTTGLPLADRQALLAQALDGAGTALTVVQEVKGEPAELLRRACADGWEGLIAKRVDSTYRSGRGPDWRKLKCSASQELVIAGWTDPTGSRIGFGALLVGYYDDGGALRYAGKVGTGFDDKRLQELSDELAARARADSPFADTVKVKGAHWVEPDLVGAIAFTEWTTDGRLRHPSFQGLRPDKEAREVRRETEA